VKKSKLLLLALLLNGCVTAEKYPRSPLVEQILKPRQGHTGLTNRACEAWDEKNNCTSWVVKDYDLADSEFRQAANKLGFVCKIAGKRYKVCIDKPGFCRITYEKHCTLGVLCKTKKVEEFLDVSGYQYILDANTLCFSKETHPFSEVN
jgi:hypothetical protein